jgi:hypothetical protein
MVHSERPELWRRLFHVDDFHLSPSGSYLEAAVLHGAIFGRPPPSSAALPERIASLWRDARFMAPPKHPVQPMPTRDEAAYLLDVAARVTRAPLA